MQYYCYYTMLNHLERQSCMALYRSLWTIHCITSNNHQIVPTVLQRRHNVPEVYIYCKKIARSVESYLMRALQIDIVIISSAHFTY